MALLKNMPNSRQWMGGKLDEKWQGPYEVVENLSTGRYKLKLSKSCILKKACNSFLLKESLAPIKVGID